MAFFKVMAFFKMVSAGADSLVTPSRARVGVCQIFACARMNKRIPESAEKTVRDIRRATRRNLQTR